MKRIYKKVAMGTDRLSIIEKANRIIADYEAAGYRLTLRQLFYRFVAGDLFPDSWADEEQGGTKNTQRNYKRLGDVISDGRMAGMISWEAIEDRTRELASVAHWPNPAEIVSTCARSFRLDKWSDQPYRVECWVEKDALEGVVSRSAHALDVAAFSCRGYTSQSSMWEAARRLLEYVKAGQRPIILHLGDHDPSGIDMTRDIGDRLNDFVETDWLYEEMAAKSGIKTTTVGDIWESIHRHVGLNGSTEPGRPITVVRVALNMDQVQQYAPPPNPAKTTDARYRKYADLHGEESWELDALEPTVLDSIITENIRSYLDAGKFNRRLKEEKAHCTDLAKAAKHWNGPVSELLSGLKK